MMKQVILVVALAAASSAQRDVDTIIQRSVEANAADYRGRNRVVPTRLWGWRLAIVIITTQVLGDVVNCVRGDLLRGGTGIIIAGALLLFLLQPRTKATFV
jgi:hypothetical protein